MTEATPKVYKVAVWATGGVGEYAIRTITDRPNLELTGVWCTPMRRRAATRRTRPLRSAGRVCHPR